MTKADKEGQRKTPILRFKGFTDDWEQRKLEDIVEKIGTGKSNFKKSKKDIKNIFPILGSTSIIGYDSSYDYDGNFILTARVGNAGNLYKYCGKAKISDNTIYIQSNEIEFSFPLLMHNNLKKLSFGSGRSLIKSSELKKYKVTIPNKNEKECIGNIFYLLDNLITLYERKIEKLESIYHYFQKNIFKHLYETKDTLNLGDFVSVNTGKLDANAMCNDGKYDFYTSGIKKYKINSFSFSGPAITVAGNGATIGYLHLADGKFDAYQRTYVINNFQGVSRKYIYYTLQYVLPRKIYKESRTGSIPYIVKEMLTGLKIPELDNSTQKLIGGFFYKVNNLITSYKQIHNELTKIKSFCLNTMFI